jgi:hypothetical protein
MASTIPVLAERSGRTHGIACATTGARDATRKLSRTITRSWKVKMRTVEYEFTLPDGSKRYEFVDPESGYNVMAQIRMFSEIHGAVEARPVRDKPTNGRA